MSSGADIPTFEAAAAAAQRGDYARAIDLADRLLAKNPRDPNALQVLGLVHARQGRNQDALDAFQRADASAPNQPPILNSIGALLRELGDAASARAVLERAVRLAPLLIEAHYNLAAAFADLGDGAGARRSYEAALKLNPRSALGWGRFARFLENDHQIPDATMCAERALAIDPKNTDAHLTLANIDARAGAHESVIARLAPLALSSGDGALGISAIYGALARSLEKLGRYEDSFAASARANERMLAHYAGSIGRRLSPFSPDHLARFIDYFGSKDFPAWTAHQQLDGPVPVFLTGFPRSGTTLLDQILSSHAGVFVMEEKDNLIDAAAEIVLSDDGAARLASLSRDDVSRLRGAYWRRAGAHVPASAAGKLIVDKGPLNSALLGLIHRLFPEAKILFALRDPRDAVLSCFQQTFGINVAMYQFLELDTAARYYDQVMTLSRLYREKLPLKLHEVRYENVVGDLRSEIEPLLAFLGLDWSDAMERYYETARTRVIRTPSAKQVIEKPYKSAIGKWRGYEKQMLPVLPMLAPWAKEFGYDPE